MSDSDNIDARISWSGSDKDEAETLSDAMIFRYCLEGTYDRSTFLKGATSSINVDELIMQTSSLCIVGAPITASLKHNLPLHH